MAIRKRKPADPTPRDLRGDRKAEEVAACAGVNISTLFKVERGERGVSTTSIGKVAGALGVTSLKLFAAMEVARERRKGAA